MKHEDIRHKLSDYLDGAVTAGEKAEIEGHLKACAKCSDALAELRKTIEQIKSIEDVEPPAWLTQKIMAKVRADAEQKRGLIQRLFFPLRIKLPIEAIAVLFIAVTTFYVYQTIKPEMKFSEAPSLETEHRRSAHEFPKQEAPRKQVTEKDKAAPAPAAEMPSLQQAVAPAQKRDTPQPAAGFAAEGEAKPSAAAPMKRAKAAAADEIKPGRIFLMLSVQHIPDAANEVRKALIAFDGKILKEEIATNANVLTAELDPAKFTALVEKLKRIGELKEKELTVMRHEGKLIIEIMMVMPIAP